MSTTIEATKSMTGRVTGPQVRGIHWQFECESLDAPEEIPAGSTTTGTGYDPEDGVYYVRTTLINRGAV